MPEDIKDINTVFSPQFNYILIFSTDYNWFLWIFMMFQVILFLNYELNNIYIIFNNFLQFYQDYKKILFLRKYSSLSASIIKEARFN